MSLLAIDTATQVSSAAVMANDRLAAELTMQAKLTHSETLLPHIEQVLRMANVRKEELDGIAVSIGPGSFTGLRIGLATAKAMAYALKLPIIGVPTLEALAYHYESVPGVRLVALMDAQKGNAYVESYVWEQGELTVKSKVEIRPLKEIIAACADIPEPVILMGDVVPRKVCGKIDLPANVKAAPSHLVMPRAACVARLGLKMLAEGKTANVMNMEPVYIRRSEAEVLWEKRHPEAEL